MNELPAESSKTFRRHHALAIVPLLALLFAPYIANRLEPRVLGMPFLLGWVVVWVIITSLVMAIILHLDGDVRDGALHESVSRENDMRDSVMRDSDLRRGNAREGARKHTAS